MIWLDVEQNSPEWKVLRLGKAGSSSAAKFMANLGKSLGDPAQRYALQLALERINKREAEHGFRNDDMDRGHEQEPLGRAAYEQLFFVDVTNGGYFDCGEYGDSPDGLVGTDGVVEIKSVIAPTHEATIRRGKSDPAYKWQIVTHLDCTGRDWVDFVSYCSDYPEWNQLVVYRTYRDEVEQELKQLAERRAEFLELVRTKVDEITSQRIAA